MSRVNATTTVQMLKASASSCGSSSAWERCPSSSTMGRALRRVEHDTGNKAAVSALGGGAASPPGCFLASAKVICLENQSLAFALSIPVRK